MVTKIVQVNALYNELMNNYVYGKTMGNLRNRIDVRLISNKKRLK